ncbi:MAG TPA: hypothetical protein PLF71_00675 [bacterium]|nr:MAG: hypothetical protein BWY14_00380 [Parcubacteria group bacterium ADurb.Bin192]HPN14619.1 hypothetical protein [bacterium]
MNYLDLLMEGFNFALQNGFWIYLVVVIFNVVVLRWLKPWRMDYTASAVVNTPLITLYALAHLFLVVPWVRSTQTLSNPYISLAMVASIIVVPVLGYIILSYLDRGRKYASPHPRLHSILNVMGAVFFMGFIAVAGFGSFFDPSFIAQGFSLKTVWLFMLFIISLCTLLSLVLAGLILIKTKNDPYMKLVLPYAKWLYRVMGAAAVLGLGFYLLDVLI